MVYEDESGSLGGLSALMGQFGLSAGSSDSNLDKILQLSKSRTITQGALFEKVTLNQKEDYIANHLIESFNYLNNWKEGGLSKILGGDDEFNIDDFKFTRTDVSNFSMEEKKALKKIHAMVVGDEDNSGYFSSDGSSTTRLRRFNTTSSNEISESSLL